MPSKRYKRGLFGTLAELRFFVGAGVAVLTFALLQSPKQSTGEIGFLGILEWLPFAVAAGAGWLCAVALEGLGTEQEAPDDENEC